MPSRPPTRKQLETLKFVKNFTKKNKWPPSIKEVATKFGITWTPAQKRLRALEAHGLISREYGKERAISVL
jgi:SOS-response transcriptional repressor LexA